MLEFALTEELKNLIVEIRENTEKILEKSRACPEEHYICCYYGDGGGFQINCTQFGMHPCNEFISLGRPKNVTDIESCIEQELNPF